MRVAGRLAAEVREMMARRSDPGSETDELDQICHDTSLTCSGWSPRPQLPGFPESIYTSVNHQVCHGIPGNKILRTAISSNIDVTERLPRRHQQMFFIGEGSVSPTPGR